MGLFHELKLAMPLRGITAALAHARDIVDLVQRIKVTNAHLELEKRLVKLGNVDTVLCEDDGGKCSTCTTVAVFKWMDLAYEPQSQRGGVIRTPAHLDGRVEVCNGPLPQSRHTARLGGIVRGDTHPSWPIAWRD